MTDWTLAGILILFALLFAVGMRFRVPQRDWPIGAKNTIILLVSLAVFVLLLILLNVVEDLMGWHLWEAGPVFNVMLVCFAFLGVLGVFLPRGIRAGR